MCTKVKHLNTQRSFKDAMIPDPCQDLYRVWPTTDCVGTRFLGSTATGTTNIQYCHDIPASSSMHSPHSMIQRFSHSTPRSICATKGVPVCFKIRSDCRYSSNFFEVYSLCRSVWKYFTSLPDSICLKAFYSLNMSRSSNLNFNLYSSVCLVVSSMQRSIYPPPPMAVSNGSLISKCTSHCGSVTREIIFPVKGLPDNLNLMQLSKSHFSVIFGALAMIIGKISKPFIPGCAKQRCHHICISVSCRHACPVDLSASRQLSLSISVYLVDYGARSRMRSSTNSPSTWGAVAINLQWRLSRLGLLWFTN